MPAIKISVYLTILVVLLLTPFISPILASAQETNIYKALQTPFYDPNDCSDATADNDACGPAACNITVDSELNGNDNPQKAFNYFVAKGLTPVQSASIVGNLMQESHVNPNQAQLGGGPGRGIAQWSVGGRWDVLLNWAKDTGNKDPKALETQLGFIWYELNSVAPWSDTLAPLKAAQTVPEATAIFVTKYEAAGIPALSNRINYANGVLAKYGGETPPDASVPTTPPSDGDGCGSSSKPGQNTQFIDGFTVYSQYDPDWVNAPYSTSTVGESGCGPAAMAMIITALTGIKVTPDVTAKYAGAQGIYVPGQGSAWTIAPVLATHWHLKATAIGASAAKITATLQAGGLVIASGQGPEPFTSGGHYIVIRAVTTSGQWKVGDSGHNNTSDQNWPPAQLLSSMNGGSVYAITK